MCLHPGAHNLLKASCLNVILLALVHLHHPSTPLIAPDFPFFFFQSLPLKLYPIFSKSDVYETFFIPSKNYNYSDPLSLKTQRIAPFARSERSGSTCFLLRQVLPRGIDAQN